MTNAWWEIVVVAVLGFWTPAGSVLYLITRARNIENRDLRRLELELKRDQLYQQDRQGRESSIIEDEVLSRLARVQELQEHLSRDLSSEITQELAAEVAATTTQVLTQFQEGTAKRLETTPTVSITTNPASLSKFRIESTAQTRPGEASSRGSDGYRVLSELSHSLKTPLAHIEASLRIASATDADGDCNLLMQMSEDMLTSVEICKSTLAAFREVTRVSRRADDWSPQSLRDAMLGAHRVYSNQINKRTIPRFLAPSEVSGYSNNYLMALILPILENAIEASPNGGPIDVDYEIEGGEVVFRITNQITAPIQISAVETPGETTKNGHEGIGIQVVRSLVGARSGGSAEFSHDDSSFTSIIRLPGGSDNG